MNRICCWALAIASIVTHQKHILFWNTNQGPLECTEKMSRFTGTPEQRRLRALLRQVRDEAGLKQVDLARKLNQSQSFVSKYESGERRLDLLELRDICTAVGIPLTEFVRRFDRSFYEARSKVSKPAKAFLGERPER